MKTLYNGKPVHHILWGGGNNGGWPVQTVFFHFKNNKNVITFEEYWADPTIESFTFLSAMGKAEYTPTVIIKNDAFVNIDVECKFYSYSFDDHVNYIDSVRSTIGARTSKSIELPNVYAEKWDKRFKIDVYTIGVDHVGTDPVSYATKDAILRGEETTTTDARSLSIAPVSKEGEFKLYAE